MVKQVELESRILQAAGLLQQLHGQNTDLITPAVNHGADKHNQYCSRWVLGAWIWMDRVQHNYFVELQTVFVFVLIYMSDFMSVLSE